MYLAAIVGGTIGAIIGVGVGLVAFDNMITGIALAIAFGVGIGGVLYAIATDQD